MMDLRPASACVGPGGGSFVASFHGLPSAWPRVLLRVAASAPDAVLNGGA